MGRKNSRGRVNGGKSSILSQGQRLSPDSSLIVERNGHWIDWGLSMTLYVHLIPIYFLALEQFIEH
jgi:hypothetical protein